MRVLILGGTGLTGPFVARGLLARGHEVTAFHRGRNAGSLPDGVRQITGEFGRMPPELRSAAPDVVVHMMAMTEADAAEFLARFRGHTGRAVVISSGDVYRAYGRLKGLEAGPPGPPLLTEDAPLRESRYPDGGQYDKVLVESALRAQAELPVTILRYPAVYGPGDRHQRVGQWLARMQEGVGELRVAQDFAAWRWTHGFAEDAAEATVLAATHPRAAGRTYHTGEADTPTWGERLAEWARIAGWQGRVVPVPAAELPEDQRMPFDFAHHLAYDTSRIRQELGFREVVTRDEGVARSIAGGAGPP